MTRDRDLHLPGGHARDLVDSFSRDRPEGSVSVLINELDSPRGESFPIDGHLAGHFPLGGARAAAAASKQAHCQNESRTSVHDRTLPEECNRSRRLPWSGGRAFPPPLPVIPKDVQAGGRAG